jgi:Spy/CpxP family protein refolding chaperone
MHNVKWITSKGRIFNQGEQTMRKTTKWTMTAMVLLFTAAIATSAFGFGWGRGPGFGSGPCGGDFARIPGLELTAEQKVQLDALRNKQFEATESLRADMFARRDALRTLWLAPTPDRDAILAAQKEMRVLRDQLQDKMTAFRLDALNILTPEQREKLQSAGPGRGFGPGRGMGPGACAGGNCPGGDPGPRGNR